MTTQKETHLDNDEDEPSNLIINGWVKKAVGSGVLNISKDFMFSSTEESVDFITSLIEVEHKGETIIEISFSFENKSVNVAVVSTKEEKMESLLDTIENIYNNKNV